MALVTFFPSANSVTVESGTSLLDAATEAGVVINAPCGGEGACGECRVKLLQGDVERVSRGCLSADELGAGWILACSSRVAGDVTIEVKEQATSAEQGQIVTGGAANQTTCHFRGPQAEPLTTRRVLQVPVPSLENSFSDLERLSRALRDAGIPGDVHCGLDVLRKLAGALRAHDHLVTVGYIEQSGGQLLEIVDIDPGDALKRSLGVAIDIGTTTCAVHLVDLAHDHILGTGSEYNGQRVRGLDIISRINYAKTAERREELRKLVLNNLNTLIAGLCRQNQLDPSDIDNAVIVGNTTMIHLLLGLDSEYIRLEPYTPTINQPPLLRADEVGLRINPNARIIMAPSVGSYVGGDITSGVLQSELAVETDDVRLFLDIGTNGEIVIGNGEWLMACAASAGPAFEGAGVSCGMRASQGAIERVRVNRQTGHSEIKVIGGGKPRGICGSGMIDLLAELWLAGLLDPSGKLIPGKCPELIAPAGESSRNLAYTIVQATECETGEPILIDELDIQNLLRAKAAIYSACALMLKQVGLDFDCITQIYVAGGFGRFLDLEKAIMIGMLPDLPLQQYVYLGNSALDGAHTMLVSRSARERILEVAGRMTYIELNVDPSYMDEYMAALFLPHTDIGRFPSVQAKLNH